MADDHAETIREVAALRTGMEALIESYVQNDEGDIAPEDGWRFVRDLRALLAQHHAETIESYQREYGVQVARADAAVREVAALRARVHDLTDWHETKAEKATRFPGEGREALMAKAAQVHTDAADRLRALLVDPTPEHCARCGATDAHICPEAGA